MTVLEMVERLQAAMGTSLEPDVRGEASHEIHAQYLDATRARTELGWKPEVGLDEGLRRTVDWYRSWWGRRAVSVTSLVACRSCGASDLRPVLRPG